MDLWLLEDKNKKKDFKQYFESDLLGDSTVAKPKFYTQYELH